MPPLLAQQPRPAAPAATGLGPPKPPLREMAVSNAGRRNKRKRPDSLAPSWLRGTGAHGEKKRIQASIARPFSGLAARWLDSPCPPFSCGCCYITAALNSVHCCQQANARNPPRLRHSRSTQSFPRKRESRGVRKSAGCWRFFQCRTVGSSGLNSIPSLDNNIADTPPLPPLVTIP